MGDITALIQRAQEGDGAALGDLFQALYPQMRRLAHSRLRRHLVDPDLGTTALVHECYLKLHAAQRLAASSRAHFVAYAASAMRSIIVDIARAKATTRRGANAQHVTLDEDFGNLDHVAEAQILQVHEALQQVSELDPRLGQLVEMRYFGGLSDEEIAAALGIADRTVRRDWQKARVLLAAALR